MSSLPLRFLLSWQGGQFFLRIGATSLMKLIGPFGAGAWACAALGASSSNASPRPRAAHKTQKQTCERFMAGKTPWKDNSAGRSRGYKAGLGAEVHYKTMTGSDASQKTTGVGGMLSTA